MGWLHSWIHGEINQSYIWQAVDIQITLRENTPENGCQTQNLQKTHQLWSGSPENYCSRTLLLYGRVRLFGLVQINPHRKADGTQHKTSTLPTGCMKRTPIEKRYRSTCFSKIWESRGGFLGLILDCPPTKYPPVGHETDTISVP